MTDSTLSTLTAASTPDGTELLYAVQGGADRKVTASQLATYAVGTVGSIGAMTASWTSSGTTYTGIGLDVTESASATGSWILRLSKNGSVIFGVRRDGAFQFTGPAFSLQLSDSTITGGNDRGAGAADFQLSRTAATQVAFGPGSFVAGQNNTASGNAAIAIGLGNTASGNYSVALGGSNTVTGGFGVVTGNGNVGFANCLVSGALATDRGLGNSHTHGFFGNGVSGQSQTRLVGLTGDTTTATPLVLTYISNATPSASNTITLPNDSTLMFEAKVVARRTDADNESAAFLLQGCIDRNTNAASIALVGTVTKTVVARDSAAWDVAITADTTLGGMAVTVTGEAAKSIRWMATVRTYEVVG